MSKRRNRQYRRPQSYNPPPEKIAITDKKPARPKLPPGLFNGDMLPQLGLTMDAFSNPMARLGHGTSNIAEYTQYHMERITQDYHLMDTLYRDNWSVKRLIDVVPEDMVKNWYKVNSQMKPEQLRQLTQLERRTQLRAKILDGLRWGRLYGGAAGIIVIDGQDDQLDQPLSLDMIMPGSFKGLIILDRWSGIAPGSSIVSDIDDPDFGLPEYYTITDNTLGSYNINVHHSRVIRFPGRPLPYYEKIEENFWGASELEHVFAELKKRDNTSWNIASLVFMANLKVYRMEGMEEISIMPASRQKDLYRTLEALNQMMNSQGMQVIGPNDTFETHPYSFAGLADVYETTILDVAGAAGIPVTKLFGRSPAGMNATGESDLQNYYDSIEEQQESQLGPSIDILLPIECMSEFGAVPDDLDYSFVSPRRPTEDQKKNIAQQVGSVVKDLFSAGVISQRTALEELKNSSEMTGMWDSISDEEINSADDGTTPLGELTPLAGNELQLESGNQKEQVNPDGETTENELGTESKN
jgi:phage-related protein (TIGR01555 family)